MERFKKWWISHLPEKQAALSVYGIVILLVYGWTFYWFIWKLPSWLYYLSVTEILTILAYSLVINLFESWIIMGLALLVSLLLPPKWFRDVFSARGTAFAISLLYLNMRYLGELSYLQDIPSNVKYLILVGALIIGITVFFAGWIGFVRKALDEVANRAIIFVYIFLPLSALSLLVVLIRNILA